MSIKCAMINRSPEYILDMKAEAEHIRRLVTEAKVEAGHYSRQLKLLEQAIREAEARP